MDGVAEHVAQPGFTRLAPNQHHLQQGQYSVINFRVKFARGDGLDGPGRGLMYLGITVPVPTFEKLWFRFRLLKKLWFRFRFRFLLLKSYGSGSGSSSISIP